jgi:flagellar protein FlaG
MIRKRKEGLMLESIKPVTSRDSGLTIPFSDSERQSIKGFRSEKESEAPRQTTFSQELLNEVQSEIKQIHNLTLEFSVHQTTGKTMIKVVDKETDRLIREIPPEDFLDLSAKLGEMIGILFDKKV